MPITIYSWQIKLNILILLAQYLQWQGQSVETSETFNGIKYGPTRSSSKIIIETNTCPLE